jgi:hypothetical protein
MHYNWTSTKLKRGADLHGRGGLPGRGGAKSPPEPQVLIAPGTAMGGNLMTEGRFTLLGSVIGLLVMQATTISM